MADKMDMYKYKRNLITELHLRDWQPQKKSVAIKLACLNCWLYYDYSVSEIFSLCDVYSQRQMVFLSSGM
jgi:hypothetical protein